MPAAAKSVGRARWAAQGGNSRLERVMKPP